MFGCVRKVIYVKVFYNNQHTVVTNAHRQLSILSILSLFVLFLLFSLFLKYNICVIIFLLSELQYET